MTRNIIPLFIPHRGCQQACVFCNQRHITGEPVKSLEAIERELLEHLAKETIKPELAYYGGTFTGLPVKEMIALLDLAKRYYDEEQISGIRISTHPATVTDERVAILGQYPIALVELGVQSFSDKVLESSKRGCTERQIMDSIERLRAANIPYGIQLMMGLPEDSMVLFQESVQKSILLKPKVVRLYPTVVIDETELAERFKNASYQPLSLEESIQWSAVALKAYHRAGIPVIRLGLHASEELVTGKSIVAGPFHPAFKQLVDSEIVFQALERFHSIEPILVPTQISIHPSCVSAVSGQKGRNRRRLEALFGNTFSIKADPACPIDAIVLESRHGHYSINKWD